MTGVAREWGLGWKRHGETKERRAARRGSEGKGEEGPENKSVERKKKRGEIKGTVKRKNSASSSNVAAVRPGVCVCVCVGK